MSIKRWSWLFVIWLSWSYSLPKQCEDVPLLGSYSGQEVGITKHCWTPYQHLIRAFPNAFEVNKFKSHAPKEVLGFHIEDVERIKKEMPFYGISSDGKALHWCEQSGLTVCEDVTP